MLELYFRGPPGMRDNPCALLSGTVCKVMRMRQRLVIAPTGTVPPSAFLSVTRPCTVAFWHQGLLHHCYSSSYLSPLILQITTLDKFLRKLSVLDHRVRA